MSDVNLHTMTSDATALAKFIVGFWPGLEDGINWNSPDSHPVLAAARRVLARKALTAVEADYGGDV